MTQNELPKSMVQIIRYGMIEGLYYQKMAEYMGVNPQTTFYSDLSIAECGGEKEISKTFNNVVNNWLNDVDMYKYFVLCVNWKSWEWYDREGETSQLGAFYSNLYYQARDKGFDYYKDKELNEFWSFLD